ncbi:unnamed protein product [Closterium sp. Naga37s-1]|nr:unnamed protein product [Closterium sp. Naga37s-1]
MGRYTNLLLIVAAAAGTAAGVYLLRRYYCCQKKKTDRDDVSSKEISAVSTKELIDRLREECSTSKEKLLQIAADMKAEMVSGLRSTQGSTLKMLPSYVDQLPDGSEKGVFYALDLGGTNFRVLRVPLLGRDGGIGKVDSEGASISPELMTGTTEALFDYIASRLAAFVAKEEEEEFKPAEGKHRELGFTFSFPCDHTAINAGRLIKWTKGFNIPETVNDAVGTLAGARFVESNVMLGISRGAPNSMHALTIPFRFSFFWQVNDAVGTLAGARFVESDVMLGVILGTGSNACYEEIQDMSVRQTGPPPASGRMVINMEWGNFWSGHLPVTEYDDLLDSKSANCGQQRYEKMISGMYVGEVVRLTLLDIAQKSKLFGETVPAKLLQPNSLPTPKVAIIHEDTTSDLSKVGSVLAEALELPDTSLPQRQAVQEASYILEERGARPVPAVNVSTLPFAHVRYPPHLQLPDTSLPQRQAVQEVSRIFGERGARLVAAGIVGVLQKLGRDGKAQPSTGEAAAIDGEAAGGEAGAPGAEAGAGLGHVPRTVVAVDGGMYEHYTPFREGIHETLKELLGEEVAGFVSMKLSKDGSGIGAALLAASHSAYKE